MSFCRVRIYDVTDREVLAAGKYGLGVDLGTSFTGAAAGRAGHIEMTSLGSRTMIAPSVVFATSEGRVVTGEVAARRAIQEPSRALRDVKRRLGDSTPLILGGTPYSPAKLMAAQLRDAVDEAARLHGSAPEVLVLSHPAVWGPYRREQFDEVPQLAGIPEDTTIRMVTEPVAAATHYTAVRELSNGDIVAVYDLGGGTFDAAVLRWQDGEMQILGDAEGVEWLGGSDFDDAILAYVDQELGGRVSALDPRDPEAAVLLSRARSECVLAKEALSFDEEAIIPVFLPQGHESVPLTRATFEKMIGPVIDSTIEALHRTLRSANVTPGDLSAVLLVGGSSRIPMVARTVESALGRPIVTDAHPKHAVALGAARIAAQLIDTGARERESGRSLVGPAAPGPITADPAAPARPTQHGRRRPVMKLLPISLIVVICAALIGTLYAYTQRSDSPGLITSASLATSTSPPPVVVPGSSTSLSTPSTSPSTKATGNPKSSKSASTGKGSAPSRRPSVQPTTTKPKPSKAFPVAPASVNLAAGHTVTVTSSIEDFAAANVTDGDSATYWEGAPEFPQRLRVDLGSVTTVGRLQLMLPDVSDWNSRTQTLAVYGSRNGTKFTRLRSSTGYLFDANAASRNSVSIALTSSAQRFIELRFTANSGWKAAQLSELRVRSS